MVSVVPAASADRTPPRVIPKVFADIPSQKELVKAEKARAAMRVWVILLFVVLVGTGGLIAWEILVGRPAIAEGVSNESGKALKEVNAKLKLAEESLKKEGETTASSPPFTSPSKGLRPPRPRSTTTRNKSTSGFHSIRRRVTAPGSSSRIIGKPMTRLALGPASTRSRWGRIFRTNRSS